MKILSKPRLLIIVLLSIMCVSAFVTGIVTLAGADNNEGIETEAESAVESEAVIEDTDLKIVFDTIETDEDITDEIINTEDTTATSEEPREEVTTQVYTVGESTEEPEQPEVDYRAGGYTPYDVPLDADLQQYIVETCYQYGVPVEIIFAMIERESNFDIYAVGIYGEVGLMQIIPETGSYLKDQIGLTDLSDPRQNVQGGCWLLSLFLNKGYSLEDALICYNAGEGTAGGLFSQGIHSTAYTCDIFAFAEKYK